MKKDKPFVHLHVHTKFSLLDGACHLDPLMDAAVEMNMPAIAITDHGVMYGLIDFYKAAKNKGVKPLLGCETYVAQGSRFDRKTEGRKAPHHHLVLLAKNDEGYHNLVRVISAAHLEGFYYKPRIDKELLAAHSGGLVGLSACLNGEVASHLVADNEDAAVATAGEYADILGKENFFLEIMDHGIADQRKVNQMIKSVSTRTGLPIVATNDVHYLKKEHAAAHEVLLCLQTQSVMSDPRRMRYSSEEFYLKSRAEMERLFREFPNALDVTLDIADMCNVEIEFDKLHFPTFKIEENMSQKEYLIKISYEGISRLYGIKDPRNPSNDREREVMDRFDMELNIIERTGFINYFLVVWDFVRFANENDIPVGPGRGSGGGSLLAYAIGITTIDPLRYGLIFERFLNPERVSAPDFDIDFCQSRRGEVIEYVKRKYGRDHVAQIITFGSLGAKTVIKDVGRALEVPYAECDRFSKMIPEDPKMTLRKALDLNPEFKKTYATNGDCKRILDYGFVLEGLYRNPGIHAAGVVIGEKPLTEIIPLARDKDKQPVTQYTKEPIGEIGLLKMDFLGLKTLTVIHESVELVKERTGKILDMMKIPLDDPLTYELLNQGNTVGVFQLESPGMRKLIRRVQINKIEDLIAMIALYRPGPMNMLDDYVARKTGKAKITYDDDRLAPILKETYGVMLYQEQVQKAANILAGYSLGEADILRRAMGKKKQSVMEQQRSKFVSGCLSHSQIKKDKAGKIFDRIAQFAGYGFNKAHSAGYGIISFQTAYLKAHYPAEFMSALLSSEIGNFDKIPVFIKEIAEMDLALLPPDINASSVRFRPEGDAVRFGLAGIKNVGTAGAESIVAERSENGEFKGLIDLCSKIDGSLVNKKVLESLIRCGAFDSIDERRSTLFNGIDFAMSRAANNLRDKQSGQANLFDILDSASDDASDAQLPVCADWKESELLGGEKELLGLYLSGHPLTRYASLLERYQLTTVTGLKDLSNGTETRLGGVISQITKRVTKKKEPMAIIQLEDLDGSVEVVIFPQAYNTYGSYLVQDAPVLICGDVTNKEGQSKIVAQEVYPLDDAPRHFATKVSLHLPVANVDKDKLDHVADILRTHPGNTPVNICVIYPAGEKVFLKADGAFDVFPDDEMIRQIEHELGEDCLYVGVNTNPFKNPKKPKQWSR